MAGFKYQFCSNLSTLGPTKNEVITATKPFVVGQSWTFLWYLYKGSPPKNPLLPRTIVYDRRYLLLTILLGVLSTLPPDIYIYIITYIWIHNFYWSGNFGLDSSDFSDSPCFSRTKNTVPTSNSVNEYFWAGRGWIRNMRVIFTASSWLFCHQVLSSTPSSKRKPRASPVFPGRWYSRNLRGWELILLTIFYRVLAPSQVVIAGYLNHQQ